MWPTTGSVLVHNAEAAPGRDADVAPRRGRIGLRLVSPVPCKAVKDDFQVVLSSAKKPSRPRPTTYLRLQPLQTTRRREIRSPAVSSSHLPGCDVRWSTVWRGFGSGHRGHGGFSLPRSGTALAPRRDGAAVRRRPKSFGGRVGVHGGGGWVGAGLG
jgi:hypothetical protein